MKISQTKDIRTANSLTIIRHILDKKEISRARISEDTGLNKATVSGSLTLVLSPHFKEPLINSLFWAYFFVKFFVFIRAILYYMWYNNLEVMIYVCCNQWCWQL